MANTRQSSESNGYAGDPDRDFDGTFPGSSPLPRDQHDVAAEPASDVPPDAQRTNALEIMAAIKAARIVVDTAPSITPGTLMSPVGRAVLGARAWSDAEQRDYLASNPGSFKST